MESTQNPGYFATAGWLPTPGLRVASDRPTGGAHGWLKSAFLRGELRAVNFAPGSPLLDWTLPLLPPSEHKSERSGSITETFDTDFPEDRRQAALVDSLLVMPQDTGVGWNVVLDGLNFASLRRVWEQTFGAAPPSSLSRVFMRRVLAYERQCRTHGWHSATTRRALAAMANGTPGNGAAAPAGSVSAGTHLVREWNGRTYQVEVIDNGYRFDGKTYPSLTTIAKRITGTHWSGPRFFGLTPKRKA